MAVEHPPLPVITYREGPAPTAGPLPGIRWSKTHVELDLPGHGSVAVSVDGITITGPHPTSREHVHGQLGTWARGQWLRAQGLTTINGTCIATNDRAIVITGAPRAGSSLLALALIERGWQLTSDGLIAWDRERIPWHLDHSITADRAVVPGIPATRITPLTTGRDRVAVHAPATGTGTIAGSIILGRRLAVNAPQITRTDPRDWTSDRLTERLTRHAIPALVPHSLPTTPTETAPAPSLQVIRPISVEESVLRSASPPVLADLVEPALREFCS